MRKTTSRLLLSIVLVTSTAAFSQIAAQDAKDLFTINLNIDDKEYKKLHQPRSVDLKLTDPQMFIEGHEVLVDDIHTRGKSSLKQRRKSLTVKLDEKVSINVSTGNIDLKDFFLVSLSMDQKYYYNRLAFDCLSACGIFPLGYRYVSVVINGIQEGIYLLVERPFDHMLDVIKSPYAMRRLTTGKIDDDKYDKDLSEAQVKQYRDLYMDIIPQTERYKEEKAYEVLNSMMDIHGYMRWLAFNYLVRNGDYTDEVYYYIDPELPAPRFKILPWDYDDIFMREPHEGQEEKSRILGHKLLFSSEDLLDRHIAADDYIYAQYLDELELTLSIVTDEFLKTITDQIKADLKPYMEDEAIIAAHKSDYYGGTTYTEMCTHMDKVYDYLVQRRSVIYQRIAIARAD